MAQDLHKIIYVFLNQVIMIIKLNPLISISRQREESIQKSLTKEDRIKGDRLVMAILFLITIVVTSILA